MSTLPEDHWDEILNHSPEEVGWTDTENFHYYTVKSGEGVLTTSGVARYYQKRAEGILQHIFSKELWNREKAWSYLEGLAVAYKLRLEEMKPVKLAELDDADLDEDHERLHRYYQEWLDGEHRNQEEGDWSFGDLLKAHIFVVDELKSRSRSCNFDDKLSAKKSLIQVVRELKSEYKQFEGFLIWDDEIHDPVKVIFKGGPTSGNVGHSGLGGVHGGSNPMSGYCRMMIGTEGWDDIPQGQQKQMRAGANGVPDDHFGGLEEIVMSGDWVNQLHAEDCAGAYKNDRIAFVSDWVNGTVVVHEMGHHIWNKYITIPLGTYGFVAKEFNKGKAGWSGDWRENLRGSGLRGYSFSNAVEFWADSYAIWGAVNQGNKKALPFQENYRVLFPRTATILDDIFGD